jgi:hypothetical protein
MMLNRLLHPDSRTLSDFADGELPAEQARNVGRHVAGCSRCRDFVWSCRRIDAAAEALRAPQLPASLRQRTLERCAAREDMILPTRAQPVQRSRLTPAVRAAAVAAALVVAAAVSMIMGGTSSLAADGSELRIMPEHPRAGDTIHVEYRPSSRLSGHERLRLRARHARVNSIMYGIEHTELAMLGRGRDGLYTGRFVLPDGVKYAVLAVEDVAAADVDHNGERWDVLLHDAQQRPLHDALEMKFHDLRMRNSVLAAEVADEMLRLYPHSLKARINSISQRAELLDAEDANALRAIHRDSLPALLARHSADPDVATITDIVFLAQTVRDTVTLRVFRERLIAEHALAPAAQQQRALALYARFSDDRAAYWRGMEELWEETESVTRHGQIMSSAWQAAQRWQDEEALARWGRRMAAGNQANAGWVGQAFAGTPALRDEGIELLRHALAAMEEEHAISRPLTYGAAEFDAARMRNRGQLLVAYGSALMAAGHGGEGEAVLGEAVDLAWQPSTFRAVAEARFRTGDTIGALQLLARVAVDPATPAAFADSARARAGSVPDLDAHWRSWQEEGRAEMQRHMMVLAGNRPVRGKPQLLDAQGARQTLDPAAGELTFVAFWSRFCTPSLIQLRQLAQVGRTLEARGVRVITITAERPGAGLNAFLTQQQLDLAVLHDVDSEARRAFDIFGTPTYAVVDGQGRVRFQGHTLEDVLRQVHLLQRPAAGP